MLAPEEDVSAWFDAGADHGDTHVIVVRDRYDDDFYCVTVPPDRDIRQIVEQYNATGDVVEEVYSMALDKVEQMSSRPAWHLE